MQQYDVESTFKLYFNIIFHYVMFVLLEYFSFSIVANYLFCPFGNFPIDQLFIFIIVLALYDYDEHMIL